jgi:hypothetical protein
VHVIKKWCVAIKLLDYLDQLVKLLIGLWPPFPL